jgi:hypothetical protein
MPGALETDETGWQVPEHRTLELAPRRGRYAVAVFVIDEGRKLLDQLERMRPHCAGLDVVVADGGSRDGSTERAELEPRGVNTLLVKTGPGRLSAQMRMAFAWALRRGYAGVVTIDGNGKDDPSAIPAFAEALDAGADHVQGSRFVAGGRAVRTPPLRLAAIRLLHAPLVSLAARHRYTDTTNGFRAYSRRLLVDPRVAPFRDCFSSYELHYYLAIRAARLGFAVRELPVTRVYPARGPTPTKISPLRGNARVLRDLARACLGRFDPAPGAP